MHVQRERQTTIPTNTIKVRRHSSKAVIKGKYKSRGTRLSIKTTLRMIPGTTLIHEDGEDGEEERGSIQVNGTNTQHAVRGLGQRRRSEQGTGRRRVGMQGLLTNDRRTHATNRCRRRSGPMAEFLTAANGRRVSAVRSVEDNARRGRGAGAARRSLRRARRVHRRRTIQAISTIDDRSFEDSAIQAV